ncbi:MAG: hypothetical protein P4L41_08780 [Flavipsychrobacter sp.]|nr:hypothetical protein [Flavipsychrobacter sp.]
MPIFSQQTIAQIEVSISYQNFYDELSPYGQWISDSQYGYVWVPDVDNDFRPYYTAGHWVMTEYGNTWVSDYIWGWACFHYGRWTYNDYYCWVWVPGTEWGPGWVAWRWGNGYCGWAPLYPGIDWIGASYHCPENWWMFKRPRYLYKSSYYNSLKSRHRIHKLIQLTRFVTTTSEYNNLKYYSGPSAADVEELLRRPIYFYPIGITSVHGTDRASKSLMNVYLPTKVEEINDGHLVPAHVIEAPRAITRPKEVEVHRTEPRPFNINMQNQNPAWNGLFQRYPPSNNLHFNPSTIKRPGTQQPPVKKVPVDHPVIMTR